MYVERSGTLSALVRLANASPFPELAANPAMPDGGRGRLRRAGFWGGWFGLTNLPSVTIRSPQKRVGGGVAGGQFLSVPGDRLAAAIGDVAQ